MAVLCTSFAFAAQENMTAAEKYLFYKKQHSRLAAGETRKNLEDAIPDLDHKMRTALKKSQKHWSSSVNFDEMMRAEILDKTVLKNLGIPFEEKGERIFVSAGIMHSYGYLFSQLQTKFGLKGKRWIESRIDERIGLKAETFSPFAKKEFLSQLTVALDRLLAGRNLTSKILGSLEESIVWQKPDGRIVKGAVRTTLAKLKILPDLDTKDVYLLVYQVKIDDSRWKYVTAFPVEQGFASGVEGVKASRGVEFKPRYNLYIDPEWKVITYVTEGFKGTTSESDNR